MDDVVIEGVEMTTSSARLVEAVGCSPSEDVRKLRDLEITREELLAECLNQAEENDVSAWEDYVAAVARHAARIVLLDTIEATIEERGNGFPEIGDYVPGDDGQLYRVAGLTRRIQTGSHCGAAHWMSATVEAADWSDCEEKDEFPALAIVATHHPPTTEEGEEKL